MSCRGNSQPARLLAYLKKHRFITRAPAFSELGIANLWARAADLRAQGHRIDGKWTKTREGARVKQYWLVEGKRARAA